MSPPPPPVLRLVWPFATAGEARAAYCRVKLVLPFVAIALEAPGDDDVGAAPSIEAEPAFSAEFANVVLPNCILLRIPAPDCDTKMPLEPIVLPVCGVREGLVAIGELLKVRRPDVREWGRVPLPICPPL